MSDIQTISITQQGYDELVAERDEIRDVKLPAAIERVSAARAHGDLSENAEYHAAKEDLSMLEGRLDELESLVQRAKVVQPQQNNGTIAIGSQVTVEVDGKGKKHVYTIVGEWEADPMQKKISEKSPLGQALLGRSQGEKTEMEAPAGKIIYHIQEVK